MEKSKLKDEVPLVDEVPSTNDDDKEKIKKILEENNRALEASNKALEERLRELQEKSKQLEEEKRRYELIKVLDDNKLPLSCVDLLNTTDDPDVVNSKIAIIKSILAEGISRGRDERINQNRYVPPADGGDFKNKNNTNKSFYDAFVGE